MTRNNRKSYAFTLIEVMVVILIINILIALLLPSLSAMRETTARGRCRENLSKIVLAIKAHEEASGLLPTGTANPAGPIRNIPVGDHMGWIPRILPFLEQTPLYRQIDFAKGVYEPENAEVWAAAAPPMFACPNREQQRSPHSDYAACHDGVETPIDTGNRGVFRLGHPLRSRDVPDGNSYTIWLGETSFFSQRSPQTICDSLGWMAGTPGTLRNTGTPINAPSPGATWPMPLSFEGHLDWEMIPYKGGEKPEQFYVGGFGSMHPGGANFAFGDGQVRELFDTIDRNVYRQLGRRDDQGPSTLDK